MQVMGAKLAGIMVWIVMTLCQNLSNMSDGRECMICIRQAGHSTAIFKF